MFSESSPLLTTWERIIQRKADVDDIETRRSIFLGLDMDSGAPVCIPRDTLNSSHYHVRGMTRSGKTATALMPLVFQVLRGYRDASGKPAPKSPVVILDLKGDQAFFNAVRNAALSAGQRFRYFSTRLGDDYHFFDPFQMFKMGHMLPIQLATTFVRAFSLDYGLIYGGLYFTQQNLIVLVHAVEELLSRPGTPTIEDLARILHRLGKSAQNSDARHIEACLGLLARYPQVNATKNQVPPNQRIDMLQVLEDCEVVYFFLEMEDQAPALRQVASLALYTLEQAAKFRYRQSAPQRHTYVLIDEFYHIAGKSFGELLSTVADWGLHIVLANQSRKQLENHDPALPEVVQANTGVEQALTFQADDEMDFRKASGEIRDRLKSHSYATRDESMSVSDFVTSCLTDHDLKRVNDTKLASLVIMNDGKPHREGKRVLKVQGLYPISEATYQRYRRTPLPQLPMQPPELFDDAPEAAPAPLPAAEADPVVDAEMADLEVGMQAKWAELSGEELQSGD
jgi:hypothetical protein